MCGPAPPSCENALRERPTAALADAPGTYRPYRADTLVVEHDGPVTVVTINRPERRNAVDSVCADQLRDAFLAFDADDAQSVAVLTGAEGAFCAGADLKAISEGDRRPIPDQGTGPMGPTRLTLSKPVIAAVEGYAVAGGIELALWCDLRVAAEDAIFGVFCRRFGVPLCDLGTVRLPRIVGHGRAMDLILTGRAVTAPEALDPGPRQPGRGPRPGARRRRRPGPPAGRAPPVLPALGPHERARAVGPDRGRGGGQRGAARARGHQQRGNAGRGSPVRGRGWTRWLCDRLTHARKGTVRVWGAPPWPRSTSTAR